MFQKYAQQILKYASLLEQQSIENLIADLSNVADEGRTVYIIGNGGSASSASHWATDMSKGVYHRSGIKMRVLSLTDNVSWITAMANDSSYDEVFADQLRVFGEEGDLLIAISASGNSANILRGVEQAKALGIKTYGVVGFDGGKVKDLCDELVYFKTPSKLYGHVEDLHMMLNHYICDRVCGVDYSE